MFRSSAFVFCMLYGFAAAGFQPLEPEFLKCLEDNELDALNITFQYGQCTQEGIAVTEFDVHRPDTVKDTLQNFCKEYKSQKCKKQLLDKLEPCLTPERQEVLDNLFASDLESNKYVCKDNGKELTDLLTDEEQLRCLGNAARVHETCEKTLASLAEIKFLQLFQKETCENIINTVECYVDGFRNACEKYDIIEYLEMSIKASLLATSCKTYYMEKNA